MDFEMDPNLINVICRVCLLSESDTTMFSIYSQDEQNMLLSDKILQCTNLEIKENPNLPDQICTKCIQDLDASYRFRMNCESSDAILQNYLKKLDQTADAKPIRIVRSIKEEYDQSDGDDNHEQEYQIEEFLDEPDDDAMMIEIKYEDGFSVVQDSESEMRKIKTSGSPSKPKRTIKKERVGHEESGGEKQHRMKREKGPKPPQICDICGSPYATKTELNAHMRRHLGEKPYKCDQCDKAFTISSGLRVHMRTHTGEKPYACKFCETKFSDFGSRNKHERRHTGERPYICATCGKTFTYSYVLVNHMLTHTGEKKYECSVCGKRFTKSHHLKQHNNVHLREQGLPYTKYVRKRKVGDDMSMPTTYVINNVDMHNTSVVTLITDQHSEDQG